MEQKELFPLFPPTCSILNRIILIPTAEFGKLKGKSINNCRIFILVCSGELSLQIKDSLHVMKSFSLLDLMEGIDIHILSYSSDLEAYCLIPNYEFAKESLKTCKPGPENYLLDRLYFPVLHISEEEGNIVKQQMLLLQSVLGNLQHSYRYELALVYFKSFMLEVGNLMLLHNDDFKNEASFISKRDLIMMDFMKLVWKFSYKEHNVDFYSDKLCISTKHLSRVIKDILDKTPHEIICDELMKQAFNMLEDESVSVGQIAENLNFADQASFCKFFKKRAQISPMEYKKRMGYKNIHLSF